MTPDQSPAPKPPCAVTPEEEKWSLETAREILGPALPLIASFQPPTEEQLDRAARKILAYVNQRVAAAQSAREQRLRSAAEKALIVLESLAGDTNNRIPLVTGHATEELRSALAATPDKSK